MGHETTAGSTRETSAISMLVKLNTNRTCFNKFRDCFLSCRVRLIWISLEKSPTPGSDVDWSFSYRRDRREIEEYLVFLRSLSEEIQITGEDVTKESDFSSCEEGPAYENISSREEFLRDPGIPRAEGRTEDTLRRMFSLSSVTRRIPEEILFESVERLGRSEGPARRFIRLM
jgi:hypothetical protein